MTLYRINTSKLDPAEFLTLIGIGALVVVEPTDRICAVHGTCTWIDNVYLCASHDPDDPCSTFDVVRVDSE